MEFKTAVLTAFVLALGLPVLTIVALETAGTTGLFFVGSLFIGVVFLVIWSDFSDEETTPET
jgi:hypothetical protein